MTFAWWHLILALIPILPNLWSIWDIWTHSFKDYQQKILWLIIAVFLPVLGALLYLCFGYKKARIYAKDSE